MDRPVLVVAANSYQRWTDQCDFGHDSNRRLLDGTYCGQNAASGYGSMNSTVGVSHPKIFPTFFFFRGVLLETLCHLSPCQGWYSEVEDMAVDCTENCDVDKFG